MRIRLIVFSLLALTLVALATLTLAAPSAPTLLFAPSPVTITAPGISAVELRMSGAQDLGAYEVELAFDPAVVAVHRVERVLGTPTQPTPGRDWTSLPLSEDPDVTFDSLGPGLVTFGAYSLGDGAGATGDVTLARVYLRGVEAGTSALRIERALVTNDAAIDTPTASEGRGAGDSGPCIGCTCRLSWGNDGWAARTVARPDSARSYPAKSGMRQKIAFHFQFLQINFHFLQIPLDKRRNECILNAKERLCTRLSPAALYVRAR
ncbi:MAG: hypothetical protein KIS91_09910 [Anaerolineae bacterium]|nr:hypothetical protein [Anaerolineae bacterium]